MKKRILIKQLTFALIALNSAMSALMLIFITFTPYLIYL